MTKPDQPDDVARAYEEALDYLYAFINLEHKTLDRYHASKMDPDRPRRLLAQIGDPQHRYPTVHIAGTKGKGSVAAMCASALRAAGLKVGLYTSPHLRDFRERIRILTPADAQGNIPKADLVRELAALRPHVEQFPGITWFEIVTAIAFSHFAAQEVDIAVIEVGLGGRLDATNVVLPLVSAITSLSLDHMSLLGDTLAEIAYEKGGIIKPGVPVVSAPQREDALQVLRDISAKRGSSLEVVGDRWRYKGSSQHLLVSASPHPDYVPAGTAFEVGLSGLHQLENAMVAIATLYPVQKQFPALTLPAIQQGLAEVVWDGRLQVIAAGPDQPTLLVDSAHNAYSAAILAAALRDNYDYDKLWFVFGAPADKAIPQMMEQLFPPAEGVFLAAADHPRAAAPQELAEQARALGFAVETADSPAAALAAAYEKAGPNDLICATGSIIFVGDLLNQWDRLQSATLPS